MSTLNTSNIRVPSVATMAEHLVDSNPHPQYMLGTELASFVKATIGLGDLADVILGTGLPSKSLIVYDGMGNWSNIAASTLIGEIAAPDATTTVKGQVRLTTAAGVLNPADSSTVVTPWTLDAWQSGKGFVYSSNFRQILSEVFQDSTATAPFNFQQLKNVQITDGSAGQVLYLKEWNQTTSSGVIGNSTIVHPKATSTVIGTVYIATSDQVISGVGQTEEQQTSSGYYVPSVAAVKSLFGAANVSRVTIVSQESTVYKDIIGHASSQGVTGAGYNTIVNTGGVVIDHVVSGGYLTVSNGAVHDVSVTSGFACACPTGTDGAPLTTITSNILTGKLCGVSVTKSGIVELGAGGRAENVTLVGGSDSADIANNSVRVREYGSAVGVIVGTSRDYATASAWKQASPTFSQGEARVSNCGIIDHCDVYALGTLSVSSGGVARHVNIDGYSAQAVVSGGILENASVMNGGCVTVSSGGVVNGLVLYSGTTLIASSGATVTGLVKLGGAVVSNISANITKIDTRTGDILIYSNSTSSNISSGADGVIVSFTASSHPTGIRKVAIDSDTNAVSHTFYPMAANTRIPNSSDSDYNDYTIDATGLDVWTDIYDNNPLASWFVTF